MKEEDDEPRKHCRIDPKHECMCSFGARCNKTVLKKKIKSQGCAWAAGAS